MFSVDDDEVNDRSVRLDRIHRTLLPHSFHLIKAPLFTLTVPKNIGCLPVVSEAVAEVIYDVTERQRTFMFSSVSLPARDWSLISLRQ